MLCFILSSGKKFTVEYFFFYILNYVAIFIKFSSVLLVDFVQLTSFYTISNAPWSDSVERLSLGFILNPMDCPITCPYIYKMDSHHFFFIIRLCCFQYSGCSSGWEGSFRWVICSLLCLCYCEMFNMFTPGRLSQVNIFVQVCRLIHWVNANFLDSFPALRVPNV